jgi:hypothetical protein
MPEINSIPTTTPNGMQIPLSVRQKLLAAQLLTEQAGSTNTPIYHKGVGYAKLLAGGLGGLMSGYETSKIEDQQRLAAQSLALPLNGASSPPAPSSVGAGGSLMGQNGKLDPQLVSAYARQAFISNGVNPDIGAKVLGVESGAGAAYEGDRGPDGKPSSFGPLQLHYGSINPNMSRPGMGDAFTAATGLDARDPSTAAAQIDYAASQIPNTGWAPWQTTASKLGLGNRDGIGAPPPQATAQAPMRMSSMVASSPAVQTAGLDTPQSIAAPVRNVGAYGSGGNPPAGSVTSASAPKATDSQGNLLYNPNGSLSAAGQAYRAAAQSAAAPKTADLPAPGARNSSADTLPPGVSFDNPQAMAQQMAPASAAVLSAMAPNAESVSPEDASPSVPSGPPPVQPAAITMAPNDNDSASTEPPGPMSNAERRQPRECLRQHKHRHHRQFSHSEAPSQGGCP